MRDKPWYPVLYMFVATAFFSSILIGLSQFTRDRVEINQRLAFEKAVLMSLPLELPAKSSAGELHDIFEKQVAAPSPSTAGAYQLMADNKVVAYALPVEGQGFWDKIKGVIGIAADKQTLTGIAFYEQHETPGLGAEIVRPKFRDQFVARKIAAGPMPLAIKPVGTQLGDSEVHAVTGATQTSRRLEKIVCDHLIQWRATVSAEGG